MASFDSFELNKVAGAVLGTALFVMAVSIVSEAIYHAEEPEEPGYVIAVAETAGGAAPGGGASEVLPIAVRLQTADVAAGENSAKKCQACHSFGKGEPAKVGPNLFGIVMNHAAHMEGFKYSAAMMEKNAEGMQWTFEELDRFLENPKAEVPGTAMAFAGLKKPDERANVVAYLRTLADSPVPMPEAPAAEAAAPAEGAAPTEGAPPAEGAGPAPATAPVEGATPPAGDAAAPTPAPEAAPPAATAPATPPAAEIPAPAPAPAPAQ
jgi:cytochrome c